MSLVEQMAVERRARLVRLGAIKPIEAQVKPLAPKPVAVKNPEIVQGPIRLDDSYSGMWFWDLIVTGTRPRPTIALIKAFTAQKFDVAIDKLESGSRRGPEVYPRQVAYYLSRKLTGRSLTDIGHRFGGRDHTTVLWGYRKIERLVDADPAVAADVRSIEAMFL